MGLAGTSRWWWHSLGGGEARGAMVTVRTHWIFFVVTIAERALFIFNCPCTIKL